MGAVSAVSDAISSVGSGISNAVSSVGDTVSHAVGAVGDTVDHALNAVGTDIDNGVQRVVPGGWGTVAAVTAAAVGAPYLAEALGGAEGAAAAAGAADAAGTGAIATPVYSPSVVGTALEPLAAAAPAVAAAVPAASISDAAAVVNPVYSPTVTGTALEPLAAATTGATGAAASGGADAMLAGLGGEYAGGLGAPVELTGGISDAAALQGEYLGGLGATGDLTGGISDASALGGEYDPTGFGDAEANLPQAPEGYTEADVPIEASTTNVPIPRPGTTGGIGQTIQNFLNTPLAGNLTGGGALTGAAGLGLLLSLLRSDQAKYGVPGRQAYSGPLSQMKYSPTTYQPSRANPNMFRPQPGTVRTVADQQAMMQAMNPFMPQRPPMNPFMARNPYMPSPFMDYGMGDPNAYFAKGGSTKPKYTSKAQLSAMDPWERSLAEYNNAAYQAQMPVGVAQAPATNVPQLGQLNLNEGGHLGGYSDGGRLLRGPGDGVSDSIPATIGNKQPARLADGEFVVPARIVSELGNGSTEAGARQLYAMMDRIQKRRGQTTGKKNVAVDSKAKKDLPA